VTGFAHRHLLGMESLSAAEITQLLDLGERFLEIA
jgi:aspartate carbamoyltransferase catalytic subunit